MTNLTAYQIVTALENCLKPEPTCEDCPLRNLQGENCRGILCDSAVKTLVDVRANGERIRNVLDNASESIEAIRAVCDSIINL